MPHETASVPPLSVEEIAAHLDVNPWQVLRMLKGHAHNALVGQKVRGPGNIGRGGRWQVSYDSYLDWLQVDPRDRPDLGGTLPPVVSVADVAAYLKISVRDVLGHTYRLKLPTTRFGRGRRVLLRSAFDILKADLLREFPAWDIPGARLPRKEAS